MIRPAVQSALRLQMEREMVDFLSKNLASRPDAARDMLAAFPAADPANRLFGGQRTAEIGSD